MSILLYKLSDVNNKVIIIGVKCGSIKSLDNPPITSVSIEFTDMINPLSIPTFLIDYLEDDNPERLDYMPRHIITDGENYRGVLQYTNNLYAISSQCIVPNKSAIHIAIANHLKSLKL